MSHKSREESDAPVKGDLGLDPRLQAKVAPLLQNIREKALRRGSDGVVVLSRALEERREARTSHRVTPEALRAGLLQCGITISGQDAALIVLCFRDAQGFVPIADFCEHVAGKLNDARKAVVTEVFGALDTDGNGYFDARDLVQLVDYREHPKVKTGELKPEEAAEEFISAFDKTGDGAQDGRITLAELMGYYGIISQEFAFDKDFAQCLRAAWAAPLAKVAAAKKAAAAAKAALAPAAASQTVATGAAAASLGASTTVGSSAGLGEFALPKRIVGYTGHIPMCAERFGETFHRIEAATPDLPKKALWQGPITPPVDPSQGIVRTGNKANKHSFRLA